MTHPQKLSELLELTTASRHIAEHNTRQAKAAGAYGEFAESPMDGGIVGEEMATRILPKRKLSKWDQEVAARREALIKANTEAERKYKAMMNYG